MFLMLLFVVLSGALMWFYIHVKDQHKYGHIPGPRKIPILGNMLQLQQKDNEGNKLPFHQQITNLGKKYGDLMWINIGLSNMVVIGGYEAMYEALVKKGADLADRDTGSYRSRVADVDKMIFGMNHTPKLKAAKTIVHQALRVYGENVDHLEKVVNESLSDLIDKLNAKMEKPVFVSEIFMEAFANTMHILVFGRQFEPNKTTYSSLIKLIEVLNEGFSSNIQGMLLDHFPILRYVFRGTMKKIHQWKSMSHGFWSELITNHKASWNEEEESCLLDALLKNQKRMSETQSEVQFSDRDIHLLLDDIFIAGFLTSSGILSGVILQCLHNPKIQNQLYAEVCSVVGATGQVTIRHKNQLHYTRAVLFEALRHISLAALGGFLAHKAARDTSISGYLIPKGTPVMMNQWALHHDPDFWTEPWSFQPERFLEEDGSLVAPDHPNRKRLLAFGAGERVCVAEVFALNRLCMFLTSLVQRFHFRVDASSTLPSSDPRTWQFSSFMLIPPFNVRFIARE